MVDRWAMNHFTRGCLRGGDPHTQYPRSESPAGSTRFDNGDAAWNVRFSPTRGSPMPRHPDNLRAARLPRGRATLALAAFAVARRLVARRAAPPTIRRARPTRTATPRSSASPTSASSAAIRTTARPGSACKAGKCEAIPGYCRSKADCPANQECIASKCKACANDKECPGGQHCVKGTCTREEALQDRQRLPAGRRLRQRLLQQGEGAGAAARAVHAGRGVLRLQRVGADDRGDRGAGARRRLPEEGRAAPRS